jgi:hypothetical protein
MLFDLQDATKKPELPGKFKRLSPANFAFQARRKPVNPARRVFQPSNTRIRRTNCSQSHYVGSLARVPHYRQFPLGSAEVVHANRNSQPLTGGLIRADPIDAIRDLSLKSSLDSDCNTSKRLAGLYGKGMCRRK